MKITQRRMTEVVTILCFQVLSSKDKMHYLCPQHRLLLFLSSSSSNFMSICSHLFKEINNECLLHAKYEAR